MYESRKKLDQSNLDSMIRVFETLEKIPIEKRKQLFANMPELRIDYSDGSWPLTQGHFDHYVEILKTMKERMEKNNRRVMLKNPRCTDAVDECQICGDREHYGLWRHMETAHGITDVLEQKKYTKRVLKTDPPLAKEKRMAPPVKA